MAAILPQCVKQTDSQLNWLIVKQSTDYATMMSTYGRGEWDKAPMWGKGPATEISFIDSNRGNICTRGFGYVIGPPGRAVAGGENTS